MSVRRNARLRKEYLYRKGLEGKEKTQYEQKRKIKEALETGKAIPTELKNNYDSLKAEIDFDDENTGELRSTIDDEYAKAGIMDPKILVTTCRNPSSRLTSFAKEMKIIFPNAQRINRGGTVMKEIVDVSRRNEITDIVILHEHRGEPDGMIVTHLPFGPTAYFSLSNCVLRHDLHDRAATMSEAFPHLIFNNFSSTIGERLQTVLKYLFPVPKEESKRVMTFSNNNDTISFRHHVYEKPSYKEVDLKECGPRFEMKLYKLKLGTMDMSEAEDEWVLRPYMNSAKRRKVL